MIPVQLPLHEPYFDLTLIKTTHTKISNNRKNLFILFLLVKKANLLRTFFSACDEWLVPIRSYIHRDMVIRDY